MVLALDFGATHMRAAIVNGKNVRDKIVFHTPKTKKEIISALFRLIDSYGKQKVICIGVASFIRHGVTKDTPNMDFAGINVERLLKSRYKCKVFVDNDAKCAGLGELVYGHGRGRKNFVLLTLGTGIGGAVVVDGKLYRGSGYAGEPGQMFIGSTKLKYLASGSAAHLHALHRGHVEMVTELEKRVSGPAASIRTKDPHLAKLDSFAIRKLADLGDKRALQLFKDMGYDLGVGLLNIAYLFDPEVFVIGGGFANVPYVLDEARVVLKKSDVIKRNIGILHAKLGDNAGIIGAALLEKYPAY